MGVAHEVVAGEGFGCAAWRVTGSTSLFTVAVGAYLVCIADGVTIAAVKRIGRSIDTGGAAGGFVAAGHRLAAAVLTKPRFADGVTVSAMFGIGL